MLPAFASHSCSRQQYRLWRTTLPASLAMQKIAISLAVSTPFPAATKITSASETCTIGEHFSTAPCRPTVCMGGRCVPRTCAAEAASWTRLLPGCDAPPAGLLLPHLLWLLCLLQLVCTRPLLLQLIAPCIPVCAGWCGSRRSGMQRTSSCDGAWLHHLVQQLLQDGTAQQLLPTACSLSSQQTCLLLKIEY